MSGALRAWCGHCGERFDLAEVTAAGAAGSCPRCGVAFASGYAATLVATGQEILAAYETMRVALRQVRDIAPALHVDVAALAETLEDDAAGAGAAQR